VVHRIAGTLGLPLSALGYVFAVAAAAATAALPSLVMLDPGTVELAAFLVLAAGAAGSSFFVVPTGRNHGFHIAIMFIVAGTILLPPGLVVLLPLAQHLPDIVKRRYPWYIQMFNVGNYTVDAFAAWAVIDAIRAVGLPGNLEIAVGGFAGGIVYLVLNHVLLAVALRLARGHSFRESGLFSGDGFWIDLGLAGLGVALAAFYRSNPYLMPTILAPLLLGQRSFTVLAQLRKSEARFRAIFESTAMGSHVTDLDGRVVATNRSLEELLGYAEEELTGMTQQELAHPDDHERDADLFQEMSAGTRESYQVEKRLRRRDGSAIWAHMTSSLVRDADGVPEFAIGMVQDVTRRKQLEEELRHAQKMEAIGRLAGGIAHDFNNLLMVVETYGSFAAERAAGDERMRSDLEEIRKAAKRATALTRQLLAFSRRQVLQTQVFDLNGVVAETHEMLSRLIGRDIDVEADLQALQPWVKADPDELAQVVLNLAVNARDAMPHGGTLTIETADVELDGSEVRASGRVSPGRHVALRVRDTGTGMDSQTLSQIFEPFFTTKEKGKGTGLGLSTVYGIVTQSEGTLSVASEPGAGTTFTICLPRVEGPVMPAVKPGEAADPDSSRGTILLVEDEDAVRGAMRRMLGTRGYDVLEAFDAHEAIRIVQDYDGTIDLVVSDVVMPLMSGIELVEQLLPTQPDLRVLFVSGYAEEHGIAPIVAREGIELLHKPFEEAALARKVRALLEGRKTTPIHRAVP
jgi:PAS domain S-box-containing protein